MSKGIVREALNSVRYYLSPKDKRRGVIMFALLILSSLLDVFGLASLVPVIMTASDPDTILANKYLLSIYDFIGFDSTKVFLIFIIIAIFIFFLFKNVFSAMISYQQVRFTAHIALNVIALQFQKHINLTYLDFNKIGSPKLINSTVNVPSAFVNGVIRQLFILFSEVIIILIIITGMLIYKPVLFLCLALVLIPSLLVTYRSLRNRAQNVGSDIDKIRPVSYSVLVESFVGFLELRLANKQQKFKQRLLANQDRIQSLEASAYLYTLMPVRIIEMVAIAAIVIIFLYSILFSDNPGEVVIIIGLFAAAAYRLMPSMNRVLMAMVTLKQHRYVLDDLSALREQLSPNKNIAQSDVSFTDSIAFEDVTFSFPKSQQPVLQNVSLVIRKGEKVGFIGSSGSGKTTLMNLLLRFYTEQQGRITVDGTPLTRANINAWYKLIGYVKQDTFLMEASIRDNITLRDEQVDNERMHYALEQASLLHFVRSLPDGLDTQIGESGSRLSGGQRQRIGIARALYKQAEVLVLDEATSALDNETEREVSESIRNLSHTSITVFIIAHRLSTLKDCTRIYELRNGKVWAEHQYENLIHDPV